MEDASPKVEAGVGFLHSYQSSGYFGFRAGVKDRPTIKLKEPGVQARLLQFLRRRREITLQIQLYHAPPYAAGRISYVTQTNAQRYL